MSFLTPILLTGLALVALPVAIHLINRKRAVRRPFPAIEFLLRSDKRLAKRLKIKQLLLLLLRICLFVLLPLAMAQPYLLGITGPDTDDRLPTAVVFVLDDSFSMAHQNEGSSAFERAKSVIIDRLDDLRTWDQAALVLAHSPPTAPVAELDDDHQRVREALEGLAEPSHLKTDLPSALALARDIHATGELPSIRTVLVTDGAAHGWSNSPVSPEELNGLGDVELIEVDSRVSPGETANTAIVQGGFRESRAGGESAHDLWARVHHFGVAPAAACRLDLLVDGSLRGSEVIEIEPGEDAIVEFTLWIESAGLHHAEFRLVTEGPDVSPDNHHYLTLHLDRRVRALLVNGDPRHIPYRDELFYLERALNTGPEDRSAVSTTLVGAEGLDVPFDDFDVVVLANVASLPRGRVAELIGFVREGGGLLVTLGDRVQPDLYNSLFGELLPKPLRSVRELCHRLDPDAVLLSTRIARVDTTHPVFRVFDLPGGESIQSVSVFSYVLLEPSILGESATIVSYGDGGPALVEHDFGMGRVGLLTTSIDRDWTDWPIRTAYLPTMRRLIRYLARRGTLESETQALVGQRRTLNLETQNPQRVTIIDPEQQRHVLPFDEGESRVVQFTPELPGHYEVMLTLSGVDRRFDELAFSANLDPAESDLAPVAFDLLNSYLTAASEGLPDESAAEDIPARRTSLWPLLLFSFLLFLFVEAILAVRRRMYSRIREWFDSLHWVSLPGRRTKLKRRVGD